MAHRAHPSRSARDSFETSEEYYEEPISTTSLGDWAAYARGALRRRWPVALAVFLAVIALTVAYYARARPMYQVETRVLAQRQIALPSAVRSAGAGDPPTRTAEELIRRRENLVDLIQRAGLLQAPTAAPDGLAAWLPRVLFKLGLGPDPATADPVTLMVARLDKALVVSASDENIRITVKWPDPVQAYQIVEGALQNFIEARQAQEITAIDEAVALLQSRLAALRGQLDREESRRDDTRRDDPVPFDPGRVGRSAAAAPASAELTSIRSRLEAKERAIRDMEDFRRRRMLELQAQLDEKRNTYASAHPVLIGLQKEIEAFTIESPQITALREEERQLRAQYDAQLQAESRGRAEARGPAPRPLRDARGTETLDDRVKDVRAQYLHMLERVNAVQLELDGARAAFKHRYKVIWPAEVPREPVSPNPWKILPVGLLAALLLALLAAVVPDLRSRRIYEPWQVENVLGIEILSDLRSDGRRR